MKRWLIWLSTLLISGHILLELGEILERLRPALKEVKIQPFLDPAYQWYDPAGISYIWWIKYNCDELLWIITYFVMAKIAYTYHYRLFVIAGVFFLYHVLDYFLLWYNYKSSHWVYWISNVLIIFSILVVIWPVKNKPAIIKQMKN